MRLRIFGLENELFPMCYGADSASVGAISAVARFLVFLGRLVGFSEEEYFGTTSKRVLLPNQGQAYLDRAYFEVCTPECASFSDLVIHNMVSQLMVANHLRAFNEVLPGLFNAREVNLCLFANATDFAKCETSGCHENYQGQKTIHWGGVSRSGDDIVARHLIPFLAARKILEGSGLFYSKLRGNKISISNILDLSFCISQRIDFIKTLVSYQTTCSRPFICTRDESLAADSTFPLVMREVAENFNRRQLLCGEYNKSPFCNFIKIGSVSLLLEMIEEGYFIGKSIPALKGLDFLMNNFKYDLSKQIDSDLRCSALCPTHNGQFFSLPDILLLYGEWMMDYLTSGSYSGEEQQEHLYLEKLEVAKKIIHAADTFKRGEIFKLSGDIEWIMKLRFMQDYIKEEVNIEIGDDEIECWNDLDCTLKRRWGGDPERKLRNGISLMELENLIIWKDFFWHNIDPEKSPYYIWEESGLVNPLTINGQTINLAEEVEKNYYKTPANPPNRSFARKKLCDFMRMIGLSSLLSLNWQKAKIVPKTEMSIRLLEAVPNQMVSEIARGHLADCFPWGYVFYFGIPADASTGQVDNFIEEMKEIFIFPENWERRE